MIRLKKLELEGFRSFEDRISIDFPDNGLVLVTGKYNGSNSQSSGSGKSSVLLGIAYCLGICPLPSTELKNWNSKSMFASVTLDSNGDTIVVSRSPKLSIQINGLSAIGMASDLEDKLKEILGVSPQVLEALIFRPQRTAGRFISATDAEKKEFLMPLLGLDQVESALENLDIKLRSANQKVDSLHASGQTLTKLAEGTVDLTPQFESAKAGYEAVSKKLASITAPEPDGYLITIRSEQAKLQKMMYSLNSMPMEIQQLQNSAKGIMEKIAVLADSSCPTCMRHWDNASGKIDQYKQELKQIQLSIEQKNIALQSSATLQAALKDIETKINESVQKQAGQQAQWQSLSNEKEMAKRLLTNVSMQIAQQNDLRDKVKQNADQLAKALEERDVLAHAKNIMGRDGFLGDVIEETLKDMQNRVNSMLSKIPNVSEISVTISTTTVGKSGNAKKAISIAINKRGKELSFKALSGGQQSSLELCVDLAVREIAFNRSPVKIGWTALDEAMDGLDVVNKQAAIEVIKEHVHGAVLVIDHSTEVKEGFEKIINISYDGIRSVIEAIE